MNLYPIYPLFPCSDFLSQMWGGLGGGGGGVSYFMLFPTFLEKKILGITFFFLKNNSFSFNFFFMFFMLDLFPTFLDFFGGNIEKCPFTYLLNGRWLLQIVDIGNNFNMKLTGRWFPQTVDRDCENLYPIHI